MLRCIAHGVTERRSRGGAPRDAAPLSAIRRLVLACAALRCRCAGLRGRARTTPVGAERDALDTAKILIETNVFKQPGKRIKLQPADARAVGRRAARPARPGLAHVQGQGLAAGRAAGSPERLERLDPRGLRPPQHDALAGHGQPRRAHRDRLPQRAARQRSFKAVIGKPSTPTPRGLYAIYEKLPQSDPKGFLGPWALHLTAFSNVLFNYGGGPGRVAIHGRDGTSLARSARLLGLARLRARRRRQHHLDGARHPARHARPDHLKG